MITTKHLMMQIFGDDEIIGNDRFIQNVLLDAVHAAGGHVMTSVNHKFHPVGLTAIVVLADSHASVHTWPEDNMGMVDYFSCAKDPGFDLFVRVWEDKGFLVDGRQEIER